MHAAPSPPGAYSVSENHRAVAPTGKTVHAILDNYVAHKDPKVRAWPARHPRFEFRFFANLMLAAERGLRLPRKAVRAPL